MRQLTLQKFLDRTAANGRDTFGIGKGGVDDVSAENRVTLPAGHLPTLAP